MATGSTLCLFDGNGVRFRPACFTLAVNIALAFCVLRLASVGLESSVWLTLRSIRLSLSATPFWGAEQRPYCGPNISRGVILGLQPEVTPGGFPQRGLKPAIGAQVSRLATLMAHVSSFDSS